MINKSEEIVTLETFYDPMLAEIIRARLDASGFPCFLADENMGSIYPAYNQGGGGIKLKVFAKDVEACKAVLAEDHELPGE